MEVARNILFDGELLQGVHVTARPVSFGCGPIERPAANNLVLSLSGVFAQHTGPRRQVIATPHPADPPSWSQYVLVPETARWSYNTAVKCASALVAWLPNGKFRTMTEFLYRDWKELAV